MGSRSSAGDVAELAPQRRLDGPLKMCGYRLRTCRAAEITLPCGGSAKQAPASQAYTNAWEPKYGPALLLADGSTPCTAAAEMRLTTNSSSRQASAASTGENVVDRACGHDWPASIERVSALIITFLARNEGGHAQDKWPRWPAIDQGNFTNGNPPGL